MLRVREHWPARCCVLFSTVVPLGNYRAQAACSLTQSSTQTPCALTLPHSFSFFLLFLLHAGFSKSGQGGVIAAASRAEIPRDETCRNTLVIPPQQATPCGEHTPAPPPSASRLGGKEQNGKKHFAGKRRAPRSGRRVWPGLGVAGHVA